MAEDREMYEVPGFRLRELRDAEAEVERLREALVGLLPFARGNRVVLDLIHTALYVSLTR